MISKPSRIQADYWADIHYWHSTVQWYKSYGQMNNTDEKVPQKEIEYNISMATTTSNKQLLGLILDYCSVPKDLDLKQRMCYYQLGLCK